MSVSPFPVRRCLHYVDMVRCHVAAQPANKRKAYLKQLIEQHRAFLANAGVEPGLIEREIRDLQSAVSPSPTPSGGMRRAA
jgi:hypothetical protein